MSVQCEELVGAEIDFDPRTPTIRVPYIVWGSDVIEDVQAALAAKSPLVLRGLYRLKANPVEERVRKGVWRATVHYGLLDVQPGTNLSSPLPPPPPGVPAPPAPPPPPTEDTVLGPQHAFQWQMPTGHLTRSLATVQTVKRSDAPTDAPFFDRAVNVQPGDNKVEGVDLPSWPEGITIRGIIPNFTLKYYEACRRLCGRTNVAEFMSRPAGRLLYLGGSAEPRNEGGFTVTHRLAEESPVTFSGQSVPVTDPVSGLTAPVFAVNFPGFTVPPFHYLWAIYDSVVSEHRTVQTPVFAYVERLFHEGDFSALGVYA